MMNAKQEASFRIFEVLGMLDNKYQPEYREAAALLDDLLKELEATEREANKLAIVLWKRHYKNESPDFELCDSTAGVISQIDNMSAGISEKLEATERKLAGAEKVSRDKALDEVIAIMEDTIHVMTDIEIIEAIEELKSDYEASKE